ncbi:MAG TPA: hypothetical protein VG186_13445 [Solirubrobacteraceae bacterium]|jgi:hypothetical protein|nr:hypothetical protein [Solirubrobacteraceae bacterium]
MWHELRPYRRRLAVLVILAAVAGIALGELAPGRPAPAAKVSTTTTGQR